MKKKPAPWWTWPAATIALAAAIGIGVFVARQAKPPETRLPPAKPVASAPAQESPPAPIAHPIDQAVQAGEPSSSTPLPSLEDSDSAVFDALGGLLDGESLNGRVDSKHLIQRIVATIDSLPRRKLADNAIPVRGPQGAFMTRLDDDRRTIDARNYARYTPYANIAQAIDAKKLVAWYARFYPLFQEAYRDLGYPHGYFNDRLVAVIDNLLATPDATPPVALAQPNVLYEYADPSLESLSAGQKLLIRSGPDNTAIIKAKLREIRASLTGTALPPPA